jgi:hypothetical protein
VRVGAVVREREWVEVEVVEDKESEVGRVLWYARDEGGGGMVYLFQALEAFDRSIRARRPAPGQAGISWDSLMANPYSTGWKRTSNFA